MSTIFYGETLEEAFSAAAEACKKEIADDREKMRAVNKKKWEDRGEDYDEEDAPVDHLSYNFYVDFRFKSDPDDMSDPVYGVEIGEDVFGTNLDGEEECAALLGGEIPWHDEDWWILEGAGHGVSSLRDLKEILRNPSASQEEFLKRYRHELEQWKEAISNA